MVPLCLLHERPPAGLIAGDAAASKGAQQLLALEGYGQGCNFIDRVSAT